ncbi:GNAT family N-acetyltransferase [Nocardioides alcanivorans]|uniref:GNAT family N-acetyltransferase n=1 Tax=Nocardioides alcanivorans TaxID=2897352 RepID=UPI001F2AEC21|nr:GNAT family N-acetyltransferase [Nocardioides alcanivorans]
MSAYSIRSAKAEDVARLVQVEIEAGQLFHSVQMPLVAGDEPDPEVLAAAVDAGRAWVAVTEGAVAGYISAEVLDDNAHIAQVSVAPEHAGRRIGQRLIDHVEAWGRRDGRAATTLTTFRDVPWNEPYYRRLGYRILDDDEVGPALARVMEHEAMLPGLDASRRCAMVKTNPGPGWSRLRDAGRSGYPDRS